VGTAKVHYSGCDLNFTLNFFRGRLDHIGIRTEDGTECHTNIERDLTARYRDPNIPASCPNIISRRWEGSGMKVAYNYECVPSRQSMDVQFSEIADLSGRQAEIVRKKGCQLIAVGVLPTPDAGNVRDPVLAPDSMDLGCNENYPGISVRLKEAGSSVLSVRITTDGNVRDVKLVTSSGKLRLDERAIGLALRTLKFTPAMNNGAAVEVVRKIRFLFKIINVSGVSEFIQALSYQCSGRIQVHHCYAGRSTISVLTPKDAPVLDVMSDDVVNGVFTIAHDMSPSLNWSAGPKGTQSYVLVAEAGAARGEEEPALRWIILDIPFAVTSLPQGIPNDFRIAALPRATNAIIVHSNRPGYEGVINPMRIQIFALDSKLSLDPLSVDRDELIEALRGHVLASGEILVGHSKGDVGDAAVK
jgi:TonB family protein